MRQQAHPSRIAERGLRFEIGRDQRLQAFAAQPHHRVQRVELGAGQQAICE